ncbi:MAG: ribosomal L7Ae/L30e/S12e/Gadd45 family protein [Clostridia bacterium]|nr:ribosomal L7Ae/L30e/S12e/Gadd45 family protein [Clostridia bacterium]
MDETRLRGLLGLCQRAGKLRSGADQAEKAIRNGSCRLALIDGEAAPNTVKKITDSCIYYHVPYLLLPKGLLQDACGREGRMTAAVLDAGFADRIKALGEQSQ